MSRRRTPKLVIQYLEKIPRDALEDHEDIVRKFAAKRTGIRTLRRKKSL